jgi:hypothetical protein
VYVCYICKQAISLACPYTPMNGFRKGDLYEVQDNHTPEHPHWAVICPSCSISAHNGEAWRAGEILSVAECVDCPQYAKCLTVDEVRSGRRR